VGTRYRKIAEQRSRRIRRSLTDLLELPPEVMLDLPRIMLVGQMRVQVENHRGLIEYTPVKVRVSINSGELVISGHDLVVRNILTDEIILDGYIQSIAFEV